MRREVTEEFKMNYYCREKLKSHIYRIFLLMNNNMLGINFTALYFPFISERYIFISENTQRTTTSITISRYKGLNP